MAVRTSPTEAPEACNCIASRATLRQIVHVMPWRSQPVTRPSLSRDATKQSWFARCPSFSHPQKQGTYRSTSGWRAANSYTALTSCGGPTMFETTGSGGSGCSAAGEGTGAATCEGATGAGCTTSRGVSGDSGAWAPGGALDCARADWTDAVDSPSVACCSMRSDWVTCG